MKTILCFFVLTFFFVLGTSDAFGQNRPRSVNHRQQNQRERLHQGVRSGELTARESYRLGREQYQIQRMENRYRNSGDGLSNRERARLEYELSQSSRHIRRQKNDRQDYPRP